ncbi:hypothetical protein [Streptomyces olivochromogenes]|uniref:Uncharacterized protein n=1 Tax=Streptomyces olivochromogenes TaxID=1963 RepID=A0A250VF88_STROL|nr:hypothetical protein [Streptomyces olivochromogenes]KUN47450.1 hypothetical protein AQJ27_10970 [Streptomyces olivochromogenes]GAX52868.1 hypothetical protein SO3561_04387 [Streptomyces olivochromogenes]
MSVNRRTAVIACVVAFCVVSVIYSRVAKRDGSEDATGSATPSVTTATAATTHVARHPSPSAHAAAKPTPSAQPSDLPRLDHQGDGLTNCVIRYRAGDHSTAGWAVFASRAGTVELLATALNGHTYDKSWYADTSHNRTVYVTGMNVPVPLTALKSIEGTLVDADSGHEYRCLVGSGA